MTAAVEAAYFLADRSQRDLAIGGDLLARLEQVGPPFDHASFLEPLNKLLLVITNVESETYLFSRVHPELLVRTTAEDFSRQAQQLRTRLMQSRRAYAALMELDESLLDPLARRAVMLTRQDMRRAGVELSDVQRDRVARLRSELAGLEQTFARNIRDDVRRIELSGPEELDGLPPDYVAAHLPPSDAAICISTESPDYLPFCVTRPARAPGRC